MADAYFARMEAKPQLPPWGAYWNTAVARTEPQYTEQAALYGPKSSAQQASAVGHFSSDYSEVMQTVASFVVFNRSASYDVKINSLGVREIGPTSASGIAVAAGWSWARLTAPTPGMPVTIHKVNTGAANLPATVFASKFGGGTAGGTTLRVRLIPQANRPVLGADGVIFHTHQESARRYDGGMLFDARQSSVVEAITLRENEGLVIAETEVTNFTRGHQSVLVIFTVGSNSYIVRENLMTNETLVLGNQTGSGVVLKVQIIELFAPLGRAASIYSEPTAWFVLPIDGIGANESGNIAPVSLNTNATAWPSDIVVGEGIGIYAYGHDLPAVTKSRGRNNGFGLIRAVMNTRRNGLDTTAYANPVSRNEKVWARKKSSTEQYLLRQGQGIAVLRGFALASGAQGVNDGGHIEIDALMTLQAAPGGGGGGGGGDSAPGNRFNAGYN